MRVLVVNCSPVRDGATAAIVETVGECLGRAHEVKCICIDDYDFAFCKGCRTCHATAECVLHDDIPAIMEEYDKADVIVSVAPSYWADIPGQFKAFIDRCTPWCDTHEPHATIGAGKMGYTIALRTGPSMRECNRIIESVEHFYGHLGIVPHGSMGLCSIEYRPQAEERKGEIEQFCNGILNDIRV